MCDCNSNDYSLQTAKNGIVTISTPNSNLNGTGTLGLVIQAGASGTIIKSITIKATGSVKQGMVRLFVANNSATVFSLYKEVPIPETFAPATSATNDPVQPTYEITLLGDFKLKPDYRIYASTQNGESFSIVAQVLDWTYPGTLPDTCCNFKQEVAVTGLGTVTTANTNRDGTGNIVALLTAPASTSNGTMITAITIKALQSTNEGMVRFFISGDSGVTFSLFKEVFIPQTDQGGFVPSYKKVLDDTIYLQAGYILAASTLLSQSFAITVEGTHWDYPI